jgi:phage gp16-like protein
MLDEVAGVESARELDAAGRQRVLGHLRERGFQPRPGQRRKLPAKDRAPMATKVRAMLADAGRADAYADAMAKRMFKVDRWEWLPFDQLRKLVGALEYDRRRRAAKG